MSVKIPDEVSMKFGDAKVVRVAEGPDHHAALLSDGRIACWGSNKFGQCDVPAGLGPCTAVAAGKFHTVALTEEGRVVCWGHDWFGRNKVPSDLGPCKAVAAGMWHTVALTEAGRVACWGHNDKGQCDVPSELGPAAAIHADCNGTAARSTDGTTRFWGEGCSLPTWDIPDEHLLPLLFHACRNIDLNAGYALANRLPAGSIRTISCGGSHCCSVLSTGRVVCWGRNHESQCDVPAGLGPVKAIAAGGSHTVALTEEGRVVCWGDNKYGKCDVPADLGKVTEIAAAFSFNVVLLDDGRIVCWGSDLDDECQVPAAVQGRAVGICAGLFEAWAIDGDGRLHTWGGGGDGAMFVLPNEFALRISDEAWLEFAAREYPRFGESVLPERIRALPQLDVLRAMHRLEPEG